MCADNMKLKFEVFDWDSMKKNDLIGFGECELGYLILNFFIKYFY